MIYTQASFWVFFMGVLLVYSFVYKKNALRNSFLFVASIYFYYKSGGYFFILLLASVFFNYGTGISIAALSGKSLKKAVLVFGVTVNLLVLAYFKYSYFFIDLVNDWFGTSFQVRDWLADGSNRLLGSHFDISKIILPVGISFFTFQAISYIVDVYKGRSEVVKNLINFGFYLSFFPPLVAGPIVRASEFVPQIYRAFQLRKEEMWYALFLILNGLIKKMVISDYISINFVDRVFDQPLLYSGFENLMAVYGYSLQIYCDFSGYTDIAIGLAILLGFRLPINFNSPYKAANMSDFWRRWHISLSTWLRDYLYIPMGGNRKGRTRTLINLMLTMLLGGLWHKASMRLLVWGGLHGLALVAHKIWSDIFPSNSSTWKRFSFISIVLTFHFTSFCWIFFRASDMKSAFDIINRIFTATSPKLVWSMIQAYQFILGLIVLGFIIHWLPSQWKETYRGFFIRSHIVLKIIIIVVVIFILYQFKSSVIQPFIYFQY